MSAPVDIDALVRYFKRNPEEAIDFANKTFLEKDYVFHIDTEEELVRELEELGVWTVLALGEYYKLTFDVDDDYFVVAPEDDPPILGLRKGPNLGGEVAGLLERYGVMDDIASGDLELPARIRRAISEAPAASKSRKPPAKPRASTARKTSPTRKGTAGKAPAKRTTARKTTGGRR